MSDYHVGILAGLLWALNAYFLGSGLKVIWEVRQGKRLDRFGVLPEWFKRQREQKP